MRLFGSIGRVADALPVPRHRSTWGHAMSPTLLRAPWGSPESPWEAQRGHRDLSAQLFWVTLVASRASKPSLNKQVEAAREPRPPQAGKPPLELALQLP